MKPATSQHTPTPWRVYDENPLEGEVYIKADGRDNGSLVAKVVDPGDEDGMDIARDTAAFIVRAVNCHKVYEKALLRIQKALRQESGPEARSTVEMCEVIQSVVTEALAKARGH